MTTTASSGEILAATRDGDIPTISRLISSFESGTRLDGDLLAELYAAGGRAQVIGITGAPGSGKSTLVSALAMTARERGLRVAIVAVDPSSSITGGAILGDRIRMQRHTLDPGVYTRSMSSRGRLGGVSRATVDAVSVLDAAGFDLVIVETVGVGQAEVEIVGIAHTTLVVSVPGLGDDIQAIKAGLLEVADLHVVNKADRPDADKTRSELLNMLMLGGGHEPDAWSVPVLRAVATTGEGVEELLDTLDRHRAWLQSSGEMPRRERRAAAARLRAIADAELAARMADAERDSALTEMLDDVVARRLDPHVAAAALIRATAGTITHQETSR